MHDLPDGIKSSVPSSSGKENDSEKCSSKTINQASGKITKSPLLKNNYQPKTSISETISSKPSRISMKSPGSMIKIGKKKSVKTTEKLTTTPKKTFENSLNGG
jgi:hypothetical protein